LHKIVSFKVNKSITFSGLKMNIIDDDLNELLNDTISPTSNIVFITGAGISAPSNIPTYQGGIIGDQNLWQYNNYDENTLQFFKKNPQQVWQNHLKFMLKVNRAKANAAHIAIDHLLKKFPNNINLITMNIDGLHHMNNKQNNIIEVHGSGHKARCSIHGEPINIHSLSITNATDITNFIKCKKCGSVLRPHILFFDEPYEEQFYFYDKALQYIQKADLVVFVGVSGETTFPEEAALIALNNKTPVININIERNIFGDILALQFNNSQIIEDAVLATPLLCQSIDKLLHRV